MADAKPTRRQIARARLRGLFHRIRVPLVLALLAIVILIVLNSFTIEAAFVGPAEIAVRILLVSALGWAVLNLGNWVWDQRLRALRLDEPDNRRARGIATRLKVLHRLWAILVVVLTVGAALTAIPWARQIGVSVFASAGIAGIAIGIAAQPVLSNLIAGLQIAFTQPMRLEDAVIVEGEMGYVEEIGMFHVVVRTWDKRRLMVPLKNFIDQPFQNWTYADPAQIGAVFWKLDYRAPIAAMRHKLDDILDGCPLWDGQVKAIQVTDTSEEVIEVRALASARNSGDAFDLRCLIREKMIEWLQTEAPEALPRRRTEAIQVARADEAGAPEGLNARMIAANETGEPDRDPTLDNPHQDEQQKGVVTS